MAYRIKLEEKPGNAFRRIARDQFAIAQRELGDGTISPLAVHSCRKAIKRLRALVRCVAPAIGSSTARKHDKALRDIGRLLSSRRDCDVGLETVAKLEAHFGGEAIAVLRPLRTFLEASRAASAQQLTAETLRDVGHRLTKVAQCLDSARLKGRGMTRIFKGVEQNYRHGRRKLKAAYALPSDNSVHDLRKAVQVHWRQMALLSRGWPEAFAARVEAARELSQLLGDDHDLSLLKQAAANLPAADAHVVCRLCDRRQMQLRDIAHYRAVRLYYEKPRPFIARMAMYWAAAVEMSKAEVISADLATSQVLEGQPAPSPNGSPPMLAAKTPAKVRSQQ